MVTNKQISTPTRKMGRRGIVLEEKLWTEETFLFQDETLSPIFCKPKLIPLKTITMQKLEEMQRELMEKMKFPETEAKEIDNKNENSNEENNSDGKEEETQKSTDVWTADN